jgi:hypothetical protein
MLAAAVTDPEKLFWTPGEKLISIPNPEVVAPQAFVYVGCAETIAAQLELVRPKLGLLFAKQDSAFTKYFDYV